MKKFLVLGFILCMVACKSHKKVATATTNKPINKPIDTNKEIKLTPNKEVVKEVEKVVVATKKSSKSNLNSTTLAYVEKFAPLAMDEMRKFNIPASITLAQGILESGSGKSQLSAKSNNHFGIKCHKGWKGDRVYHDDDAKGECFRKYKYSATSYQDHSLFLSTRFRYALLFKLKKNDYKGWAKGLRKAGYATDPKYPNKLISFIEKYQLYRYDDLVLNGKVDLSEMTQTVKVPVKTVATTKRTQQYNKEKEVHIVEDGDTLYSISRAYGVSVQDLKEWNHIDGNTIHNGDVLNIKKHPNKSTFHTVQKKETLYRIARKYNITIDKLKQINHLKNNNLSVGQELRIIE